MTFEEIKTAWFAAKSGTIERDDLIPAGQFHFLDTLYLCFECPCGGDDHGATLPMIKEGFSQQEGVVLTCPQTRQQWLVRPRQIDIKETIRGEELACIKLFGRAPRIVEKVFRKMGRTEEAFFFLKDTHGITREDVEMLEL